MPLRLLACSFVLLVAGCGDSGPEGPTLDGTSPELDGTLQPGGSSTPSADVTPEQMVEPGAMLQPDATLEPDTTSAPQ